MSESKKTFNPPYVSVSKIQNVFNLLSTRYFTQLNSKELISRGYSESVAVQTILALKFLAIISDDGKPTENLSKLQLKGSERVKGIEKIVKEAYRELFNRVPEANMLPIEELYNEFKSVYNLSPRLADTAVPNFLWLCKEAGLVVIEAPEIKERTRQVNKTPQEKSSEFKKPLNGFVTTKSSDSQEEASYKPSTGNPQISVEVGEFELILPKGWSGTKTRQAVAKGYFKTIYDELTRLSPLLKEDSEVNGEVA